MRLTFFDPHSRNKRGRPRKHARGVETTEDQEEAKGTLEKWDVSGDLCKGLFGEGDTDFHTSEFHE